MLENEYIFGLYDKDGKGYIDERDLRRLSRITGVELTEQEISEMMATDIETGKIFFDQFSEIMDGSNSF